MSWSEPGPELSGAGLVTQKTRDALSFGLLLAGSAVLAAKSSPGSHGGLWYELGFLDVLLVPTPSSGSLLPSFPMKKLSQ